MPRLEPVQTRNWLLALLVLGIVGMHGLVAGAGGATGGHHAWPPATSAPTVSSASSGAAVFAGDHAAHAVPSTVEHDDGSGSVALALCIWLLAGLAIGVAGARRTTWVRALDRVLSRLTLPPAPVLRERTPVPRFTVMRC